MFKVRRNIQQVHQGPAPNITNLLLISRIKLDKGETSVKYQGKTLKVKKRNLYLGFFKSIFKALFHFRELKLEIANHALWMYYFKQKLLSTMIFKEIVSSTSESRLSEFSEFRLMVYYILGQNFKMLQYVSFYFPRLTFSITH